jgi:CRISP-associated protein Cas1
MGVMLPKPTPIPIRERISLVFLERGLLDVLDGAFVLVDKNGVRTHIPVGGVASLMLEPGIRVSHAAVVLAARVGCLLVFVGEAGVRLYSCGQPGGARGEKILYQAELALNPEARRRVVKKMFEFRFGESLPDSLSIEQMRGIEGTRMKELYKQMAARYRVTWKGRRYDVQDHGAGDIPNRCISSATSCLYGVCEAGILAAGYAPAVGFVHSGNARSFVYDIADLFKVQILQVAFSVAAKNPMDPDRDTRLACRDMFREERILRKVIPTIDEVLSAGGLDVPDTPDDAQPVAIEDPEGMGDAGYRP